MIPDDPEWIERFENGSGYDQDWWIGSVGGGSTYDPDYLTSSVTGAPADWGNECLKTEALEGEAANNYSIVYDSPYEDIVYAKVEIIIDSYSLPDQSTGRRLFSIVNYDWNGLFELRLYNFGGSIHFQGYVYRDGVSYNAYYSLNTVSIDTPYRIEVRYDATNNKWGWRIDGVNQPNDVDASDPVSSDGTLLPGRKDDIRTINVGPRTGESGGDIICYFDNISLDTRGWIGDQGTGTTTSTSSSTSTTSSSTTSSSTSSSTTSSSTSSSTTSSSTSSSTEWN